MTRRTKKRPSDDYDFDYDPFADDERGTDYSTSPNPRRLYRPRDRKTVSGVCAGIADYFNIDVTWVRVGAVVGLFATGFWPVVIGYIIAAVVIPERPVSVPEPKTAEEDQFWRGVSHRPDMTFSNLKYRFRDMDERLADLERVVTSDEWKLRRDFRDIE